MKIGLKLLALWAASLALYGAAMIATWLSMDVMEGISGLTIRFFLGYCGIIVVFQVFAALDAIRQLIYDINEQRPRPLRDLLR
jgi:hypothetical protein